MRGDGEVRREANGRSRQVRGGSSIARKAGFGKPRGHHGGRGRFFGFDVEELEPGVQVVVALAVLAPVMLTGVFLVAFFPGLWWIFTTYGWLAFPAFGLLLRGLAGSSASSSGDRALRLPARDKEREILETLARKGELTPVSAAMETSLTVAEADGMLKKLAEGGHLDVRARGGGLFYALWESAEEGRDWERSGVSDGVPARKRGTA